MTFCMFQAYKYRMYPSEEQVAINIKTFALQDQNLVGVAGVERTVEPVDSLPRGRRMIAGKPRPTGAG